MYIFFKHLVNILSHENIVLLCNKLAIKTFRNIVGTVLFHKHIYRLKKSVRRYASNIYI